MNRCGYQVVGGTKVKLLDVARRFTKSKSTLVNWDDWYGEYLSPRGGPGEVRHFTDEDVRVLAFINDLADRKMNVAAIKEILKHKAASGTPFDPVSPDMLALMDVSAQDDEYEDEETGLTLREAQAMLAEKDLEIATLTGQVGELRGLVEYYERSEKVLNERIDKLMAAYMNLGQTLSNKHKEEVARLVHQLGIYRQKVSVAEKGSEESAGMRAEISRLRQQVEGYTGTSDEIARLNQEIGRLNHELDAQGKELMSARTVRRWRGETADDREDKKAD